VSYSKKGLDGSHVYVMRIYTEGPDAVLVAHGDPAPKGTGYMCHECSLRTGGDFICTTPIQMIAHLFEHICIDECVPRTAIERLGRESGLSLPLGRIAVTPGAKAALTKDQIDELIGRHASADPGDLDEHDLAMNLLAVANGGDRVLSSYAVGETKLFVITEHDRSLTTVLLRREY
jgi:hypothetical protein